jgi:CRISPR-associated protein Cmr2
MSQENETILNPIEIKKTGSIESLSEYFYVAKNAYKAHELNELKIEQMDELLFNKYFHFSNVSFAEAKRDRNYKQKAKEFPLAWFKHGKQVFKNSFFEIPKKEIVQAETMSNILPDENFKTYINKLIPGSFGIHCNFKLTQPYYSHDEDDFYIIQNPILKEKVFKVPMMRGSGWKGALAHSGKQIIQDNFDNSSEWIKYFLSYCRIFGMGSEETTDLSKHIIDKNKLEDEKVNLSLVKYLLLELGSKITMSPSKSLLFQDLWKLLLEKYNPFKAHKGRLLFYPTYFDSLSLEIINPHDRNTKAGMNPIHYEVVPPNKDKEEKLPNEVVSSSKDKEEKYKLQLVYIPFDAIELDRKTLNTQVKEDQTFLQQMIIKTIEVNGIGAKTKIWGRGKVDKEIKVIERANNE